MLQFIRISIPGQGRKLSLVLAVLMYSVILHSADVTTIAQQNLVDLIVQSERILMGTVGEVSDGFTEQGVPYTEIKLEVTESLKGEKTGEYTFRQFGLMAPAETNTNIDYPGISPLGFLHWESGESVLVFLHQPAHLSGLQTTVGFSQGKLNQVHGRFENSTGISNLFENLVVETNDLTPDQIDMLRNTTTAVDAGPLLALLRRAVNEDWVGKGVMHHAD